MVWYFYLLKNIPQFVVIHTIKGFNIVNEAEVDVLLEFICFLFDPADVDNSSRDRNTTWSASWEICMQVRKQQLELDMEQQTDSK